MGAGVVGYGVAGHELAEHGLVGRGLAASDAVAPRQSQANGGIANLLMIAARRRLSLPRPEVAGRTFRLGATGNRGFRPANKRDVHVPQAKHDEAAAFSWSQSPWFWLWLFSLMALFALLVTGPKYRQRQGRLIRQFEARQGGDSQRQDDGRPVSSQAPRPAERIAERARAGWLMLAVAALALFSFVMLVLTRRRQRRTEGQSRPPAAP